MVPATYFPNAPRMTSQVECFLTLYNFMYHNIFAIKSVHQNGRNLRAICQRQGSHLQLAKRINLCNICIAMLIRVASLFQGNLFLPLARQYVLLKISTAFYAFCIYPSSLQTRLFMVQNCGSNQTESILSANLAA